MNLIRLFDPVSKNLDPPLNGSCHLLFRIGLLKRLMSGLENVIRKHSQQRETISVGFVEAVHKW